MYILLLQHCTPELEVKLKGMYTYYSIKTDEDRIELDKLIQTIFHLYNDNKRYVMATVETDKQVYLLYQHPYQ